MFEAKRKHVNDPFWDVDVPYMILRLRQGIGRLIRTSDDKGAISIFLSNTEDEKVVEAVKNVLPIEGKELYEKAWRLPFFYYKRNLDFHVELSLR